MSKKAKTPAEESVAEEKTAPREDAAAPIPPLLPSAAAMVHVPQEGWVSLAHVMRQGIEAPKSEGARAKPQAPAATLQELVLDYKGARYKVVPVAAAWARVLRRQEENRHLTPNEILQRALRDVLSGAVDWDKLKTGGELAAAAAPTEESPKEGKAR
jgi:hypothetical protein